MYGLGRERNDSHSSPGHALAMQQTASSSMSSPAGGRRTIQVRLLKWKRRRRALIPMTWFSTPFCADMLSAVMDSSGVDESAELECLEGNKAGLLGLGVESEEPASISKNRGAPSLRILKPGRAARYGLRLVCFPELRLQEPDVGQQWTFNGKSRNKGDSWSKERLIWENAELFLRFQLKPVAFGKKCCVGRELRRMSKRSDKSKQAENEVSVNEERALSHYHILIRPEGVERGSAEAPAGPSEACKSAGYVSTDFAISAWTYVVTYEL
ncbi:hypothetical protein C8R44DRAFT_725069 [Mycena epipterygia]|nr:hypothetical protein C8R44DRAFT_725069 [Mycena epipterygia]